MIKQLSIIIVTYNSERYIFDCLDSIYKYNDISNQLEIIIVDNCSTDSERMFEQISSNYSSDIILIKSTENKGYGHGNNQGIQLASAPRFIIMNPDVRLVEPVFKKLISKFDNRPNIGMIGVNFTDGSNNLYFKPEYCNLLRMLFGNLYIKFGCYKIEQMFFSGSFLVFDKLTFIKSGSFDENIFLFQEEADISNRILALGKETVLAKDISVLHLVHGRDVNLSLLKIGAESREYYFKKYHADLDKYYKFNLFKYRCKYILAVISNNKIRIEDYKGWINLSKNNGHKD